MKISRQQCCIKPVCQHDSSVKSVGKYAMKRTWWRWWQGDRREAARCAPCRWKFCCHSVTKGHSLNRARVSIPCNYWPMSLPCTVSEIFVVEYRRAFETIWVIQGPWIWHHLIHHIRHTTSYCFAIVSIC